MAQIELILLDCPIVVYPKDKGKGSKDEPAKADAVDVMNAANKWESKYKGSHGGVVLSLEGLKAMGKKQQNKTE